MEYTFFQRSFYKSRSENGYQVEVLKNKFSWLYGLDEMRHSWEV